MTVNVQQLSLNVHRMDADAKTDFKRMKEEDVNHSVQNNSITVK